MSITDEIKLAESRLLAASEVWRAAEKRVNEYASDLLRLQLQGLFEAHPEIQRVCFEANQEYDDEGGYFEVINVSAAVDYDEADDYDDALDEADQIRPWSKDAVARVLGMPEWDGFQFWITRDEVMHTPLDRKED